ncbi:amino acid adenylation domain-containing protein [Bradyrhizobium sp. 156]|uniref:non-ribosomal peptide synthetase n=1 Tax=Bradyrhizobium sp. 156 TaxID=2782630 RepID=UPI001FFB924A|nr:amino acid adenylation domain-containing protein [Bradyrhizobium sp. 156]MCK1326627.1 amino acid adenylation domain-containing protein [Bradyrhizobium sp. 156]
MTDASLSTQILQLSPEQRARLVKSAMREARSETNDRIPRHDPASGNPPLGLAQQRLWLHDQIRPDSGAYNEVIAFSLDGPLNETALSASLNEIIRRHTPLRTAFPAFDGIPVQAIAPPEPVTITVIDLRDHEPVDQDSELQQLALSVEQHSFDLTRGPLIRIWLVRMGQASHVLLMAVHHIVVDGWSVGLLQHELSVLYGAFEAGQTSPLTELPTTFADFAAWQRQNTSQDVLDQQLAYWKAQLADLPPVLQLPFSRPRPAVESDQGRRRFFELGPELRARLLALSRAEGATLFMTLCAGLQILLYRLSGEASLAVGTAVANRSHPDVQSLIGCFVNTVVLRGDLSGSPSARTALRRTMRTAIDAFDRADVPFDLVIEALRLKRSLSYNPLFQVFLVLQNSPRATGPDVTLTVRPLALKSGTSKFDIIISVEEVADRLSGYVQYNSDLFESEAIDRLIASFEILLDSLVADPDRSVDDLEIVPAADLHRMLVEWNQTEVAFAEQRSIPEIIAEIAARSPLMIAVTDGETSLTYGQLERRATALAHWLRSGGLSHPDGLVGVFVDRGSAAIVAIIGILKAGAGYVPLDPAYPAERIAGIVTNAGLSAIVTVPHLRGAADRLSPPMIVLDVVFEAENDADSVSTVSPEDIAYVIYTSGSTGTPKGVVVTHDNLRCSTLARSLVYKEPVRAFLLLSSISFDSSVAGIFWTLTQGGTLVVPSQEALSDMRYLCRLAIEQDVTHLLAIPSIYAAFLDEARQHNLGSFRVAIVAGARCPNELIEAHHLALPETSLFNEYGPTEATVWSTVHRCELGSTLPVPIGRPIPNTKIYLLDQHRQPVPIGVPGEIYIAGAGLARGYHGRPDLTSKRFVPNPFASEPGSRFYQTGDLARYQPDGKIELLGRTDRQVKVRGFRIEPESVEAALFAVPGVREAAVDAASGPGGELRLVAWVALEPNGALTTEQLREALLDRLPPHELPSLIEVRTVLPKLANGKIDRTRLEVSSSEFGACPDEPWTELQLIFGGICREILECDLLGLDDNLFELGADSLSIIRIFNKFRVHVEVAITITDIFRYPTIRGLTRNLELRPVSGVL